MLIALGAWGPAILLIQWLDLSLPSKESAFAIGRMILGVSVVLLLSVFTTKRLPVPLVGFLAVALGLLAALPMLNALEVIAVPGDASQIQRDAATKVVTRSILLASAAVGSCVGWVLACADEASRT